MPRETQIASSWIWIQVTNSISRDDNSYYMKYYRKVCFWNFCLKNPTLELAIIIIDLD